MKVKQILQLLYGMATFIPGVPKHLRGTGGTNTARYCYSVWLRHLVMAHENGLEKVPSVVAELGPGDSIGIGLAALLSGADRYFAFDVVAHAHLERNLKIFDELVDLFRQRCNIPGEEELPRVKPCLRSCLFPSHILTEELLRTSLDVSRLEDIRKSITVPTSKESVITYKAPWMDAAIISKNSVDMVYSQAVMEHIDNLPITYQVLRDWLKPGGIMSHQIDFKCHGTADSWNGHWTYSDIHWRLIRGKRYYLLNRQPHSVHIRLVRENGFRIVCNIPFKTSSSVTRTELAACLQSMTDDDLETSGAFIQGVKA
jgi:SAM-dependent methyltransferase